MNSATNIVIDTNDFTVTNDNQENSGTLTATTLPTGNTSATTWQSSDNNVLTIDASSGSYTAVGRGRATITARAGNAANSITVTVHQAATNITIRGDLTNDNGITGRFTATLLPTNHQDSGAVTWTSADTNKLTINSQGEYLTLAPGTVGVTATFAGVSNTITITIKNSATNIVINTNDFTITSGTSATNGILTATVLPTGHVDGSVTWTSSHPQHLAINNSGQYNVLSLTTNSITLTARVGNVSNTVQVTILQGVTNITIDPIVLTNRGVGVLRATFYPTNYYLGTDFIFTNWTSFNTNVLTIDPYTGRYRVYTTNTVSVSVSAVGINRTTNLTPIPAPPGGADPLFRY